MTCDEKSIVPVNEVRDVPPKIFFEMIVDLSVLVLKYLSFERNSS